MCHARRGFSLIELVIVIAIISIVMLIAVPNIVQSTSSANQRNASASMKTIAAIETVWKAMDLDGTGGNDYWCRDVAGMYYMTVSGLNLFKAVPQDLAMADAFPNPPSDVQYLELRSRPKSGYWHVMVPDFWLSAPSGSDANETRYCQDAVGVNTSLTDGSGATVNGNTERFASLAFPTSYGRTGQMVFLVTQSGVLWQRNPGDLSGIVYETGYDAGPDIDVTYPTMSRITLTTEYDSTPFEPTANGVSNMQAGPWSNP
jgi:prepilin-type N-terminal cleavage/methylation domain-containing protein